MYPAPLVNWLLLVILLLNVTVSFEDWLRVIAPPPVNPVPAVKVIVGLLIEDEAAAPISERTWAAVLVTICVASITQKAEPADDAAVAVKNTSSTPILLAVIWPPLYKNPESPSILVALVNTATLLSAPLEDVTVPLFVALNVTVSLEDWFKVIVPPPVRPVPAVRVIVALLTVGRDAEVIYPLLLVHWDILPLLLVNVWVFEAVVVPVLVVYPSPLVNWLLFVIVLEIVRVPPLDVDVSSVCIPAPWAKVTVSPLVTVLVSEPLPSLRIHEDIEPADVKYPESLVHWDILPPLFVSVSLDEAVIYPAPLVNWLLLVIVQFNVTLPEVPPPLIPVPATTAVISPCGILGNDTKSPSPLTYSEELPCHTPVIVPEVVILLEATFKAVPSVLKFTLVTVPLLLALNVTVSFEDWFKVIVPPPVNPVPALKVIVELFTVGKDAEVIYPAPLDNSSLSVGNPVTETALKPCLFNVKVPLLYEPLVT